MVEKAKKNLHISIYTFKYGQNIEGLYNIYLHTSWSLYVTELGKKEKQKKNP